MHLYRLCETRSPIPKRRVRGGKAHPTNCTCALCQLLGKANEAKQDTDKSLKLIHPPPAREDDVYGEWHANDSFTRNSNDPHCRQLLAGRKPSYSQVWAAMEAIT